MSPYSSISQDISIATYLPPSLFKGLLNNSSDLSMSCLGPFQLARVVLHLKMLMAFRSLVQHETYITVTMSSLKNAKWCKMSLWKPLKGFDKSKQVEMVEKDSRWFKSQMKLANIKECIFPSCLADVSISKSPKVGCDQDTAKTEHLAVISHKPGQQRLQHPLNTACRNLMRHTCLHYVCCWEWKQILNWISQDHMMPWPG